MKSLLKLPLLVLLLLHVVDAVKIGVSKIDTPIKVEINTTTPFTPTTNSAAEELTTHMPTTTEEPPATTVLITPSITTTTTIQTTFPSFAVPTFPTKKTKTAIKTTTPTKTATSTTTTTVRPLTAETELEVLKQQTVPKRSSYCDCDLLPRACDINCCCDADCAAEALRVFDCYAKSKYPELHSRLQDFQYQHGLPSCRVNDGWLCVFRTNIAPQREQGINTNVDTAHFYKWPREMLQVSLEEEEEEKTAEEHSSTFYKYGEPLKLFNLETLEIQDFELPFAFRPPYCHIQAPIRHLKSYQANCLFNTLEPLQAQTRTLLQRLTTTTKLLDGPWKQPERTAAHLLKELPLRRCFRDAQNQEADKPKCLAIQINELTNELEAENYYVREVAIKILHNYTNILAGAVELGVQQLNAEDAELWQSYAVEFVHHNQTEMANKHVNVELISEMEAAATAAVVLTSGPLGYLQGAPLIVARFVAHNSSHPPSAQNQVLSYFHVNATKTHRNHTLRLFTRRRKACYNSAAKEHYISYGISTHKQCELHLGNASELARDLETSSASFTAICSRLQDRVLSQLFPMAPLEAQNLERLGELYVSQQGQPANASDKWTPLQLRNAEFAPVSGHFNAEAQSFTCRNMLLSAAYEFQIGVYVATTAAGAAVPHQALVKHAALILGQRHDLEFTLDELAAVPLSVSVMFYDLNDGAAAGAAHIFIHFKWVLYVVLILVYRRRN